MTRRMEKVNDLLQSEIADLIHRRVKHPVLQNAMITFTRVEVAADLGTARVYVSVMEGSDEPEVLEALARTEPFLHRALVKLLHMRRVPRLRFLPDHSMEEADRISMLLRQVAGGKGPTA